MDHLALMKVAFVVRPGRDPDGHDHLGEALGRRAALRRSYGGCGYGSLSRIGLHRMNGGTRRRFVGGPFRSCLQFLEGPSRRPRLPCRVRSCRRAAADAVLVGVGERTTGDPRRHRAAEVVLGVEAVRVPQPERARARGSVASAGAVRRRRRAVSFRIMAGFLCCVCRYRFEGSASSTPCEKTRSTGRPASTSSTGKMRSASLR